MNDLRSQIVKAFEAHASMDEFIHTVEGICAQAMRRLTCETCRHREGERDTNAVCRNPNFDAPMAGRPTVLSFGCLHHEPRS